MKMLSPIDLLRSGEGIPRTKIVEWMNSPDLRTRAEVYVVTDKAWDRITPEVSADAQCTFMAQYLTDCLARNFRDDDYIHNGFEAAWELASWLKHLVSFPEGAKFIPQVVKQLERLYRSGDEELRNRIEVGVVEHALEAPEVRRFFSAWEKDPDLSDAYAAALEWARAHERGT
jgi:hypothetical protein